MNIIALFCQIDDFFWFMRNGWQPIANFSFFRHLSARLDFREASEELAHHGIKVSHTTLQEKVRQWSAGESVSAYVDEQALETGSRWYVSCDGVHTLSQDDSYHEVKVGCLYRDYPQLGCKLLASARTKRLRYVASQTDAASFGQQWFDLATASGIYTDEPDTEEVVVIGDGAAWIWNLSDEYFPGGIEIVPIRSLARLI